MMGSESVMSPEGTGAGKVELGFNICTSDGPQASEGVHIVGSEVGSGAKHSCTAPPS
jgi:hypothetical protein